MDVIVLNYDLFAEETVASTGDLHCIGYYQFVHSVLFILSSLISLNNLFRKLSHSINMHTIKEVISLCKFMPFKHKSFSP